MNSSVKSEQSECLKKIPPPASSPTKKPLSGRMITKELPRYEKTLVESKQKIENLQKYCTDLSSSLDNWFFKVSELNAASANVAKCFRNIYQGTNERLEKVITEYLSEVYEDNNDKITKLKEKIAKFTRDLKDYSDEVKETKQSLELREKLQVKQEKTREAGKAKKKKKKSKIKRNNEWFESAKRAYLSDDNTIDALTQRWNCRFTFFDNFFERVFINELKFLGSWVSGLDKFKPKLMKWTQKPIDAPAKSSWSDHRSAQVCSTSNPFNEWSSRELLSSPITYDESREEFLADSQNPFWSAEDPFSAGSWPDALAFIGSEQKPESEASGTSSSSQISKEIGERNISTEREYEISSDDLQWAQEGPIVEDISLPKKKPSLRTKNPFGSVDDLFKTGLTASTNELFSPIDKFTNGADNPFSSSSYDFGNAIDDPFSGCSKADDFLSSRKVLPINMNDPFSLKYDDNIFPDTDWAGESAQSNFAIDTASEAVGNRFPAKPSKTNVSLSLTGPTLNSSEDVFLVKQASLVEIPDLLSSCSPSAVTSARVSQNSGLLSDDPVSTEQNVASAIFFTSKSEPRPVTEDLCELINTSSDGVDDVLQSVPEVLLQPLEATEGLFSLKQIPKANISLVRTEETHEANLSMPSNKTLSPLFLSKQSSPSGVSNFAFSSKPVDSDAWVAMLNPLGKGNQISSGGDHGNVPDPFESLFD